MLEAREYYSAVADLIPVLFILLAFEFRVVDYEEFGPDDPTGFLVFAAVFVVTLLVGGVLGEWATLRALNERSRSGTIDFLVVAALASAGTTIVVVPLLDARSRLLKMRKEAGRSDTHLAHFVGLVSLVLLVSAAVALPVAMVVVQLVAVL
jgi:hypothetical protein